MTSANLPFSSAAVIGAGSWGTALATLLAERGLPVTLWCRHTEQAAELLRTRFNTPYLPNIRLAESISPTSELSRAATADLVLMVTPSAAVRPLARALATAGLPSTSVILSCSKGIEPHTGLRMSQILAEILPNNPIAVLSGPNHAEETAHRLATASVVGASDHDTAARLQKVFQLSWFRAYTSTDIAGIELGGAIKNVFAIAGGIAEGLGLGDNAKAALVTRGLAEMVRLGTLMGGRPETFQGLSGVGDLVVTCYSEHSRNHRLGRALGQGASLAEALKNMGNMVVEGVPNTASIHQAARHMQASTPLIDAVFAVLYNNKAPSAALTELLSRQPRPEADNDPESV